MMCCRNCRYDGLLFSVKRCNRCLGDLSDGKGRSQWKPMLRPQEAFRRVLCRLRKKV